MKSRVFSFTSLIALLVAMMAAPAAMAQTSPAQDVYNPNGEVLDVVEGGCETLPDNETGGCDEADGLDADGNPVTTNSAEDCAENAPEATPDREVASVCTEADGQDGDGNTVAYGSEEDCSGAAATPTVSEGELPFTGFEAGMVGLAGLALLGGGFVMRGVAKRNA